MGGKPYENLALLYYFCSFAHRQNFAPQLRATHFPVGGSAARNCGTDGPQPENEVLLPA